MGLFRGRPLCFFCFLFIITSALLMNAGLGVKTFLSVVLVIAAVVLIICHKLLKKHKTQILTVILCIVAVFSATVSSTLRIDYKREKAEELVGKRQMLATVTSEEYESKHSSSYVITIEELSGNSVNIKALFVCGFECDLQVGDMVLANVELMKTSDTAMGISGAERHSEPRILLMAVIYDAQDGQVKSFNRDLPLAKKLFAKNGAMVIADEMKEAVRERIYSFMREDTGSVVNGFLIGDTSDVKANVIRDFRRSGVSHLFAVSGLHITILLGAVEIILRKLFVPKSLRCVLISFLAFLLLVLTGFSMSAFRAVVMLWLVYLVFLFSEEADAPTTLFVAISVIIAVFPYSVYELGMWMSFLATLGIVTVYSSIEKIIPTLKKTGYVKRILLKIGRSILAIILMTICCNMFLLPIQWKIFGEVSLSAIPTNVLLSPLNAVMLVLSVVVLIFGGVPFVGKILIYLLDKICVAVLSIAEFFASFDFATVSLEYKFADILVIIFTVAIIVMLVIKLKRRWIVMLPVCGFVFSFTVGVFIFNFIMPRSYTYYGEAEQEIISVTDGTELCIVDMSNGSYGRLANAFDGAAEYGPTSVEKLILTDISGRHISSMDYFLGAVKVENIYLPYPKNSDEYQRAYTLAQIAGECGTDTYVYRSGDKFVIGETSLLVCFEDIESTRTVTVFTEGEQTVIGYTDAYSTMSSLNKNINSQLSECDTVIIGNNGRPDGKYKLDIPQSATVVYMSEDLARSSNIDVPDNNEYVNRYGKVTVKFKFK